MKQKIKLRDLTEEQYDEWLNQNCKKPDDCKCCIFNIVACCFSGSRIERVWLKNKEIYSDKFLDQEIKLELEKPLLSEDEKVILRNIDKKYKYIARDEDGELWLFEREPQKS